MLSGAGTGNMQQKLYLNKCMWQGQWGRNSTAPIIKRISRQYAVMQTYVHCMQKYDTEICENMQIHIQVCNPYATQLVQKLAHKQAYICNLIYASITTEAKSLCPPPTFLSARACMLACVHMCVCMQQSVITGIYCTWHNTNTQG